jgi:N-acetylglucosaminyldiphosphoundecaprenol N-acetyl-beta-D-mannosaminyltransferase
MGSSARVRLFGLPLDPIPMAATVESIERAMADGRPGAHVGLNAANVVAARSSAAYARDLEAADLVGPDGQPVVWAARLMGTAVRERVTGIDLMLELVNRAPSRSWSVYLVGGRPAVVAEVARRLDARGVTVAGFRDGYFAPDQDKSVAADVKASGADLLFVGMPSPRKERFIIGAAREVGIPYSVAVGGAFDVLAGRVRRAPPLLRRAGLEWAFRLAQEPRRLIGRYASGNARFIVILFRELLVRARQRRGEE